MQENLVKHALCALLQGGNKSNSLYSIILCVKLAQALHISIAARSITFGGVCCCYTLSLCPRMEIHIRTFEFI